MIQGFIKNGEIRYYSVESGKIIATLVIAGKMVSNPLYEDFIADGWEEYIEPEPEPVLPTIEELVELRLRERYSLNQELEIQRKRDREPEAFAEYDEYVEECITWAHELPHRDDMLYD